VLLFPDRELQVPVRPAGACGAAMRAASRGSSAVSPCTSPSLRADEDGPDS
jgi:hypothetical protein